MAEYIERDALYRKISELEELARKRVVDTPSTSPAYTRYSAQLIERSAIKHMISDAPAANVAPVVHGHWILVMQRTDGANVYRCSVCGRGTAEAEKYNVAEEKPYCHCGAKMDEEEKQ